MRVARLSSLAGLMLIPTCLGSHISFLPDGKSLARCGEGVLYLKDLNDEFPESEIKLPEGMRVDTPALARTEGRLVVAGPDLVMTWNPASKEWKELWKVPADRELSDVACDPKSGNIIFVLRTREGGEGSWVLLPKGGTVALKIFNRHAGGAFAPSFDAEGNLYFIREGDVWKGQLEKGEEEVVSYILNGSRIWPLAMKLTSETNNSGLAAKCVQPFGDQLLVDLSRDHGSGWGNIVRLPNADAYKDGLPLKWPELLETGGFAPLAVSPDGKTAAAWTLDARRWWVMEKADGNFEPLSKEAAGK